MSASTLTLLDEDGTLRTAPLPQAATFTRPTAPLRSRVVYAAAHVVPLAHGDNTPGAPAQIDWGQTLGYRRTLWSWGLGVADAMDTAQRNMGLDPAATRELITRSADAARQALADPAIAAVFPTGCAGQRPGRRRGLDRSTQRAGPHARRDHRRLPRATRRDRGERCRRRAHVLAASGPCGPRPRGLRARVPGGARDRPRHPSSCTGSALPSTRSSRATSAPRTPRWRPGRSCRSSARTPPRCAA
jgi:hypothetical protein